MALVWHGMVYITLPNVTERGTFRYLSLCDGKVADGKVAETIVKDNVIRLN